MSVSVNGLEAEIRVQSRGEYGRVVIDFPNERATLRRLVSDVKSDSVMWDVGANIGHTPVCWLKKHRTGR